MQLRVSAAVNATYALIERTRPLGCGSLLTGAVGSTVNAVTPGMVNSQLGRSVPLCGNYMSASDMEWFVGSIGGTLLCGL